MPRWNSSHVGVFCALFDKARPHARATDSVALDLPCGELPQQEFMITATSIRSFFHSNAISNPKLEYACQQGSQA